MTQNSQIGSAAAATPAAAAKTAVTAAAEVEAESATGGVTDEYLLGRSEVHATQTTWEKLPVLADLTQNVQRIDGEPKKTKQSSTLSKDCRALNGGCSATASSCFSPLHAPRLPLGGPRVCLFIIWRLPPPRTLLLKCACCLMDRRATWHIPQVSFSPSSWLRGSSRCRSRRLS